MLLSRAAHDVSDEPRDEHGRWTDGGGSDDGGGGEGGGGQGKGKHPGKGYSAGAYVDKHGVIQTNNVYDAQRALFEDRKVELKQIKQISTLIKRLGETAAEMAEHGETAPVFNLCNVTVKGTNLFCADQIGIPRAEMPVIPAKRTKDFIKHLKKLGYKIEKDKEQSRNLRASQSEISGAKVAAQMARIEDRGFYKRLVISRDDYILDGHHTWAGQLGIDAKDGDLKNDDREVKVARVDISITKLIDEAEKWTKAEGIAKKPASEAPKSLPPEGYQFMTLREAQILLDPATYRKFADTAYRFFAASGQLAQDFGELLITVPKFDPNEPRDDHGKWTDGGGDSGGDSWRTDHQDSFDLNKITEDVQDGKLHDGTGGLTKTEQDAVNQYKGSARSFGINGKLRSGAMSDEDRDVVAGMDSAMNRSSLSGDMNVWRTLHYHDWGGDAGPERGKINTEDFVKAGGFTDAGYVSTSGKPMGHEGTFKIVVPKGSKALIMKDTFQGYEGENEVILPRGSQFKYLGKDDTGQHTFRLLSDKTKRIKFNPNHEPAGSPEGGRFASGGGGSGGGGSEQPTESDIAHELNPEVVNVGGDEWNKATAKRLEREYQVAKPKLEAMTDRIAGGDTKLEKPASEPTNWKVVPHPDASDKFALQAENEEYAKTADGTGTALFDTAAEAEAAKENYATTWDDEEPSDEDEEEPYAPEEWDQLTESDQEEVKEKYFNNSLDDYINMENENWSNSGAPLDQAKTNIADDEQWKIDNIEEWLKDEDDDGVTNAQAMGLKFSPEQIALAMNVHYTSDGEGGNELEIDWDDRKLQDPVGVEKPPEGQMTFEGIAKPDYSKLLTKDQRDEIEKELQQRFEDEASKKAPYEDPPDLSDQAKDYMEENWEYNMSDDDKFEFAKNNTSVLDNAESSGSPSENMGASFDGLPSTYDPLNKTSGTNYRRTQWLARMLSIKRAQQVLADRGIHASEGALRRVDSKLWEAWKDSSTSQDGKLLQVAISDELGGRLNERTASEIDADGMKSYANRSYKAIGGYDGVKAYLRGKWETTQYLLDKAGVQTLPLYRGISYPDTQEYKKMMKHFAAGQDMHDSRYIPTLDVLRNGAASTTTSLNVANGWVEYKANPVVLRAEMPRTAAISVPAYGINIHSEREVVVAGTAWHSWDAWGKNAPSLDKVPLKEAA